MSIVLIGYMASGKSVVGKRLASEMNRVFSDLDTYIESEEGMKISEIFAEKGEVYFRKIESKYLKKLLMEQKDAVISLGGGTPCYADNMKYVLENTTTIYLKASIITIYNRLRSNGSKRPLVKDLENEQLKEFIAKHLFERRLFYEQAEFIIDVDKKGISEIVFEIKKLLQSRN